jgi:hypothetical protein
MSKKFGFHCRKAGLPDDIFSEQKSQFWLIFVGKLGYILCSFGVFYLHLVYFVNIWYIWKKFGIYFPTKVCYTKKNLATMSDVDLEPILQTISECTVTTPAL